MQSSTAIDTPLLHQAWEICLDRLFPPLNKDAPMKLFHQFIFDRYTEPKRYYHNLQHLEEMLGYLAHYEKEHGWHGDYIPALSLKQGEEAPHVPSLAPHPSSAVDAVRHDWIGTVLLLSILFHDAVYDTTRSDNEERSAELALDFLRAAEEQHRAWRENSTTTATTEGRPSPLLWNDEHAAQFVRETTYDYVLRTKFHLSVEPAKQLLLSSPPSPSTVAESRDDPLHVFLDLDLTILGQPDARVYRDRYAANIQQEYSHYPRVEFLKGRSAFLKGFLDKPQWYKTPYFFAHLETQARRNTTAELAELTAQLKEFDWAAAPKS